MAKGAKVISILQFMVLKAFKFIGHAKNFVFYG